MRRVMGVLLLAVVVGGYVLMTKEQYSGTTNAASKPPHKQNIADGQIQEIANQIEKEYPSEVKKVVEIHNELMGICYKYSMEDKDIAEYVTTVRKLYSTEFKDLNSEKDQITKLKQEQVKLKGMQLISSEITEAYIAKDDKGKEMSAQINVIHATNLGSAERTYYLIKEEGLWKINGWEATN